MKNSFLALSLICVFSLTAFSQEAKGTIEVTGMSAAEELPEDLMINIPLIVEDSTYLSCSNRLNVLLREVKEDLRSTGIQKDEFSTGNYSISENFEYVNGERRRVGFKGQVSLSLSKRYEPKLVNDFLRTAEKFSLQYTVRFMLSEDQKESLRKSALVQAVEDAKEKAEILSQASGVSLESISKISYGEFMGRPGPLMEVVRMSSDSGGADSNGLKLYPGPVSVNQSVRIIWYISQ